jgi:hypothetical protein
MIRKAFLKQLSWDVFAFNFARWRLLAHACARL